MKIVYRYISTTILNTIFLALLVVVGLELLITFISELNDIGSGDYNLLQAMQYVLLDMPRRVYLLFPMAALVGTMMGLGLLASNSELIVMRAAGVSVGQISLAVLQVAFIVVVLITIVGETLGPKFKYIAETQKAIARTGGEALKTNRGIWLRDGHSFFYIDSILPGERLQGVTWYEFDGEHHLLAVTYAKAAQYHDDYWVLENIQRSKLTKNSVTSERLPQAKLNISLNRDLLRITQVTPEQMSLMQLKSYISYRKSNRLRASNYELAFWRRLFQPVATALMIFLAIPFIFGPLRSVTMGLRFVSGVMMGFIFYILNQFFGPISLVYQLPPVLAAILPTLFVAIIAGFMLRKMG